jgi:hypothetical protein
VTLSRIRLGAIQEACHPLVRSNSTSNLAGSLQPDAVPASSQTRTFQVYRPPAVSGAALLPLGDDPNFANLDEALAEAAASASGAAASGR